MVGGQTDPRFSTGLRFFLSVGLAELVIIWWSLVISDLLNVVLIRYKI